ncbi:hypothetical protein D9M68_349900 [compost metagenome]
MAVGEKHGLPVLCQRVLDDADFRTQEIVLTLADRFRLALGIHDRDVARRLFLQQQFGGLDHRIGVEPLAQTAIEDDVGDSRDRHAMVVRIVVAHDRAFLALGHTRRREVDGIMEAVDTECADLAQTSEVGERRFRIVHAGEDRGVGRDDGVLAEAALEPERRHAEVGVLVGELVVARVERGFRNAPGRAQTAAVVDLLLHNQIVGLVEDAALPFLHHQRRHKILEHRARPGDQRAARADRHDRTAELVPVLRRQVALGDGKQTGEPCFRGEKVVAGFVELVGVDPEADGQQAPLRPEQEAEIHREGDVAGAILQHQQALTQRFDRTEIEDTVGNMGFAGADERICPLRHFGALRRAHLVIEVDGELVHVARQHREVDHPDRRKLALALDRGKRVLEADDAFLDQATQRPDRLAVVGQIAQHLLEDRHHVADAVQAALHMRRRRLGPVAAHRRYGNQVTGKVAAVDRRDVARLHGVERVRPIPVEQVAAILRQAVDGGDRLLQPVDRLLEADPAEITCRHHRQQVDADIGRRGALGQDRLRRFLEVVRRQEVLLGGHEGLEITPGAPGNQAHLVDRFIGDDELVLGFGRLADEPGDGRRKRPEQREGNADERQAGVGDRGKRQRKRRKRRRDPHGAVVIANRAVAGTLHLRGGAPFEHQLAADEGAVERAHDRVAHHRRIVGDEDDAERHLRIGGADFRQHRVKVGAGDDVVAARQEAVDQRQGRGHEQAEDQDDLPDQRLGRLHVVPAHHRGDEPGKRDQRATQVVVHLPAPEHRQPVREIEDVGQQLPVATRPAMLARHLDLVAGREVLDELDVGDQRATHIGTFEQIVAENGIFLDPALQRRLEGVDMVEALAGEAAFAGDVLVDVGNGEDIGVDAAVGREDTLEGGSFAARCQRRRHARLQQAVAGDHILCLRVDHRTVDRMVDLADELRHRIAHQARVGIERHHVLHVVRHRVGALQERGVAVAAKQHVQFVQLAALALPTHPHAFLLVEQAAAMQEMEARLAIIGVARRKLSDLALGVVEHIGIGARLLNLAIGPVAEQREINLAARVGEVVHLEIAHEFVDMVALGNQARYDDEGAGMLGNSVEEFIADKSRWSDEQRHQRVEQAHRAFGRRQREQKQHDQLRAVRNIHRTDEGIDGDHRQDRQEDVRAGDREPVELAADTDDGLQQRRSIADLLLEHLALLADEEGSDVRLLQRHFGLGRSLRLAHHLDGDLRHLVFAVTGTTRELLDRVAILVARAEIERRIVGALA